MPSKKILATHKTHLTDIQPIKLENVKIGDVLQFVYDGEERTVFVLDPNFDKKVHALSFKSIDRKTFLKEVVPNLQFFKTPQMFYDQYLSRDSEMVKYSYRTYFRNKMTQIRKITYNVNKKEQKVL